MARDIPQRMHRRAGLTRRPPPQRLHHPNFEIRGTQGWKSIEAEEKLPGDAWRI